MVGDVGISAGYKAIVEHGINTYGGFNIIGYNAGIAHAPMSIFELPEETYDRVFSVNTKNVYLSCVHGVPALRDNGGEMIANVASIGAKRPRPMIC